MSAHPSVLDRLGGPAPAVEAALLGRVALALSSTLELRDVLRTLGEVTMEAAGVARCSLFVREDRRLVPAVAIGAEPDDDLWTAFRGMGPVEVDSVPSGWERLLEGRAVPVEEAASCELIPPSWVRRFDLRSLVLVPILAAGEPFGLMVVDDLTHRRFRPEELALLEAIGRYAGVAVRNARLFEAVRRGLRHREVLYELSASITERAQADSLVRRLSELLEPDGVQVTGLAFRDTRLARHVGGEPPVPEERSAWRSGDGWASLPGGGSSVPMRLGRRIVGGLRVRTAHRGGDYRSFLEAVARGVAEVASRGALAAQVQEVRRDRAVAAERDRIAADLHDTAGQLFVGIGLLARGEEERVDDRSPIRPRLGRLAELADQGKWEIDRAVQALAFVPARRKGLVPSLRGLARTYQSDSGIRTLVEVGGTPIRLPAAVERALFRVAHEALANAWRHARCQMVRVEVVFARRRVTLRVGDDGVGLGASGRRAGSRVGMAGMRRAMAEVGGSLRAWSSRPCGAVVEATWPDGEDA